MRGGNPLCRLGGLRSVVSVVTSARRYYDPSCLLVRSFVGVFVNMCSHVREFVNISEGAWERRRDERRTGAAGARATRSRTYIGERRELQCPASIQAAAKDVREKNA